MIHLFNPPEPCCSPTRRPPWQPHHPHFAHDLFARRVETDFAMKATCAPLRWRINVPAGSLGEFGASWEGEHVLERLVDLRNEMGDLLAAWRSPSGVFSTHPDFSETEVRYSFRWHDTMSISLRTHVPGIGELQWQWLAGGFFDRTVPFNWLGPNTLIGFVPEGLFDLVIEPYWR